VRIFAVIGDGAEVSSPAFAELNENHDAMLAAYRSRRWAEAARRLAACQATAPEALAALFALYAQRIAAFSASPPPADWDGVYVALTK
jgi:adenylate cyclase